MMVKEERRRAGAAYALGAALVGAAMMLNPVSAIAQTGAPSPAPGSYTAQGNLSPTDAQVQSFVKSLEDLVAQSLAGKTTPVVGAPVTPDVKLQPMPPAAAAAVPEVKDHHVVKAEDQTILIVDPITRQIVGVISAMEKATTGAGSQDPDMSGQPQSSQ